MEGQESEAESESAVVPARVRRGLSLIFISVLVIVLTGIAYVHPSLGTPRAPTAPAVPAAYQLAAVDFVSPTPGGFSASFKSGRFVILRTKDAGQSWTRQLTGESDQRAVYMHFFDSTHGMFA